MVPSEEKFYSLAEMFTAGSCAARGVMQKPEQVELLSPFHPYVVAVSCTPKPIPRV